MRYRIFCAGHLFFALCFSLLCLGQPSTRNFVRTWVAKGPQSDANTLTTQNPREVTQSTVYFDGLGRPEQTVIKKGSLSSGGNFDVVVANEYDAFGREVKKYMPYVASTNDGLFKTGATTAQQSFNQNWFTGQGESNFYSLTKFEPSPLNRPVEQYAPGASWAGSAGNTNPALRRGIKSDYWINTADDAVRIWNVQDVSGDFGTYATPAVYPAGELYKNVTEDERGKQVIEFKDKEGRVVLKKVQLLDTYSSSPVKDDGSGKGYDGWLCTYYIYDDLGQLRCVVQPKGVDFLRQNAWDITALSGDILLEQCFRYEYDGRGRMYLKKVPGAGPVQMVYDARDRLVMSQDGAQRKAQQWLVTVYENDLNRPVATYKMTDPYAATDALNAANAAQHRGNAYTNIAYPDVNLYVSELLTETHYDDYAGLPSGLSSSLVASGYAAYLDAPAGDYPEAVTASSATKGMVTWTRVKVLGESKYLAACNLYDAKGRLIQVQSKNYTEGLDVVTTQYGFAGQVLRSHVSHQKSGANPQNYQMATKNVYDDLGRVAGMEKAVNGGGWKPVSSLSYDALGQLKTKKLAPEYNGGAGLETLTFDYNVRGWLLGANRDYAKAPSTTGNWFGFDLGYDKTPIALSNGTPIAGYNAAAYNGNITGTVWKSKGDNVVRKYDFGYDNVNRLTGAEFIQYSNGSWNDQDMDYSVENLGYDGNGNIYSMRQRGWAPGGAAHHLVDDLLYTYRKYGVSNQLQNVIDQSNDPTTKLGDFRASQAYVNAVGVKTLPNANSYTDYTYDDNGNLKRDLNKDIGTAATDGIAYNHLNLPVSITVSGKGSIDYTYDAAGNKLKKVTTEPTASVSYGGSTVTTSVTTTTTYLGAFVYESKQYGNATINAALGYNDKLQFFSYEEGRVRLTDNAAQPFAFDYMLKDHLGNVRMVLTEEEKPDMYPAATLEPSAIGDEAVLYSGLTNTQYTKPSWFSDPLYSNSDKVARLKNVSGTAKVGPGILLKVMAGDRFNIRVASGWNDQATPNNSPTDVLLELLNVLSPQLSALSGGKATAADLQAPSPGGPLWELAGFINTQSGTTATPKAHINWVLFDEQFALAKDASGSVLGQGYSGWERVGPSGSTTIHDRAGLEVAKSGYLYIYTSNEATNVDVFFDNLQVTHNHGPLLEETHYYPFGLAMAGISSKAAGAVGNKKRWNKGSELQSEEFSDGNGLEMYATPLRSLDPQLGRWWQIDSKPDFAQSLYSAMGNNPILYNDPLGDTLPKPTNTIPVFSPTNWYGYAAIKNDKVRTDYDAAAKKITPGDKQARVDLKEKARASTPEPFKSIVEKGRPMAGEQAKANDPNFKGNVAKTNIEVNEAVEVTGKLGKVFVVGGAINSAVNIATAPEPGKQIVVETGAWVGAIQGGTTGAEFGSVFGPAGAFFGGLGGSIIGGVAGSKVGHWISENVHAVKSGYDRNDPNTWPIMNR